MPPDGLLPNLDADVVERPVIETLFDQMADTVFFTKDLTGRYASVNLTLVERCQKTSRSDIVGRRPTDVFDPELGRTYEAQDENILRSGRVLTNKLELHLYGPNRTGWCLTTKIPLRDRSGGIVGLVGVSRDLALPDFTNHDLAGISAAIDYAEDHLGDPPTVTRLAEVAGMSTYQLDRRIRRVYGLTTGQWLLRARLDHACLLLVETGLHIAVVAASCGYRDQSTFARQFRRTTGLTAGRFRSLHLSQDDAPC